MSWAGRTFRIEGAVLAAWRAADARWHPLGDARASAGGALQEFVHGATGALATICAHPRAGAWWVIGAVRDRWYEAGAQLGALGWPLEDARATADGRGVLQRFGRDGDGDAPAGAIASHPGAGTYLVDAVIHEAWLAAGGERELGLPECDTLGCGDGRGRYSQFLGGVRSRIYWTARHGAALVPDPIFTAWYERGAERGPLGYPIAGPRAGEGGREVPFERGIARVAPGGDVHLEPAGGSAK